MAKEDADIYTTDNRRIPQNLMTVFNPRWFSKDDRVMKYCLYEAIQGKKNSGYSLINKIL